MKAEAILVALLLSAAFRYFPPMSITVPLYASVAQDVRVGLGIFVASSALSMLAAFGLVLHLIYSTKKNRGTRPQSQSCFLAYLHYYVVSLLVSNMIQGLAGFFSLRWVAQGYISGGAHCTAQGLLKQVGDVGDALSYVRSTDNFWLIANPPLYSIITITAHVFAVLFFHWTPRESQRIPLMLLSLNWIFIVLAVGVPYGFHGRDSYIDINGLWCWISAKYPIERLALGYAWLWAAGLLVVILYIPLFFALRGNIVVSYTESHDWWPRISFLTPTPEGLWALYHDTKLRMCVEFEMLWYPVIYVVTILPTSTVRFLAFSGHSVPDIPTIAFHILFYSTGVLNVILFVLRRTRTELEPLNQTRRQRADNRIVPLPPPNPMAENRPERDKTAVYPSRSGLEAQGDAAQRQLAFLGEENERLRAVVAQLKIDNGTQAWENSDTLPSYDSQAM